MWLLVCWTEVWRVFSTLWLPAEHPPHHLQRTDWVPKAPLLPPPHITRHAESDKWELDPCRINSGAEPHIFVIFTIYYQVSSFSSANRTFASNLPDTRAHISDALAITLGLGGRVRLLLLLMRANVGRRRGEAELLSAFVNRPSSRRCGWSSFCNNYTLCRSFSMN